jgi:methylase of polypeptide subunit release factors
MTPTPTGHPDTNAPHELEFTGQAASWMNLILEKDPALPFAEARCERRSQGSQQRRDLTLLGRDGGVRVTGEVKLPYQKDGGTPYHSAVFYTRAEVVDLMNSFCIRDGAETVLDPACGGGTFLVRAYARKRELQPGRGHDRLLAELYGVDVSHFATHLTTINLATRDLIQAENYPRVARADFFDVRAHQRFLRLPQRVQSKGLGKTQQRDIEIPPLDAVIGNPPYVRQEDIKSDKPKGGGQPLPGTKEFYRQLVKRESGAELAGRSDLHCYFWPHAATFLKPDGWLCLLTPLANGWMWRTASGCKRMRQMAYRKGGRKVALADLSDQCELDMEDRRELDDAVLELLGVANPRERLELRQRLYAYLPDFFEHARQKEEKAIANKNKAKRKSAATPDEIAAQVLADIRDRFGHLLRPYAEFVDLTRPYDTFDLPVQGAAEVHHDLFSDQGGVRFVRGRKQIALVPARSLEQATLVALVAAHGARGLVRAPLAADDCARLHRRYQAFLDDRAQRIRQLTEERTGDAELQEHIVRAVLERIETNPN